MAKKKAPRCSARTRANKRCTNRAAGGGKHCRQHAALAQRRDTIKKAAKPTDPAKAEGKALFLVGYGQIGTVTGACEHAGIGRSTHYRWLEEDPEYKIAYGEASAEAADRLEQEARRRAVAGTQEPVFYQGEIVGHVRKHSDTLLIFLLKGAKPEKYRERHHIEHDGSVDANVHIYLPDNGRAAKPTKGKGKPGHEAEPEAEMEIEVEPGRRR